MVPQGDSLARLFESSRARSSVGSHGISTRLRSTHPCPRFDPTALRWALRPPPRPPSPLRTREVAAQQDLLTSSQLRSTQAPGTSRPRLPYSTVIRELRRRIRIRSLKTARSVSSSPLTPHPIDVSTEPFSRQGRRPRSLCSKGPSAPLRPPSISWAAALRSLPAPP